MGTGKPLSKAKCWEVTCDGLRRLHATEAGISSGIVWASLSEMWLYLTLYNDFK